MTTLIELVRVLPWPDWLALVMLFGGWTAYARFAKRRATVQPSVLDATNRERRRWMREATVRENRVLDGIVVQNLSSPPAFFASTTISSSARCWPRCSPATRPASSCARYRSRRARRCWCSTSSSW